MPLSGQRLNPDRHRVQLDGLPSPPLLRNKPQEKQSS